MNIIGSRHMYKVFIICFHKMWKSQYVDKMYSIEYLFMNLINPNNNGQAL